MATRKRARKRTVKRAVKKIAIPRNKWIKGSVKVSSGGIIKIKTNSIRTARKRATKRRR